jgi:hypothetical protein
MTDKPGTDSQFFKLHFDKDYGQLDCILSQKVKVISEPKRGVEADFPVSEFWPVQSSLGL